MCRNCWRLGVVSERRSDDPAATSVTARRRRCIIISSERAISSRPTSELFNWLLTGKSKPVFRYRIALSLSGENLRSESLHSPEVEEIIRSVIKMSAVVKLSPTSHKKSPLVKYTSWLTSCASSFYSVFFLLLYLRTALYYYLTAFCLLFQYSFNEMKIMNDMWMSEWQHPAQCLPHCLPSPWLFRSTFFSWLHHHFCVNCCVWFCAMSESPLQRAKSKDVCVNTS